MAKSVINVLISGDNRDFKRALGDTESRLSTFGTRSRSLVRGATLAIGGLTVAMAGAALAAKPLINAASDQEEAINKANTVFGSGAQAVQQWSMTTADAIGTSRTAALEAASGFGQMATAAGLNDQQMAEFGTRMTDVAADVASFNNLSTDEAIQKLMSGLAGETEPLRRIGVFFNAAAVEAKAMELGLADANGEVSDGNKILARQALILEQLGDQGALGDFARTSDGLANSQRRLAANFEDVSARIGTFLLPAAQVAVEALGGVLDYVEGLIDIFEEEGIGGVLRKIGTDIAEGLGVAGTALVTWFTGTLVPWVLNTALPWLQENLPKWGEAFIAWLPEALKTFSQLAAEGITAAFDWLFDGGLNTIVRRIAEWTPPFLEWVGRLAWEMLQAITLMMIRIGVALALGVRDWVGWLASDGIVLFLGWANQLAYGLRDAIVAGWDAIGQWIATGGALRWIRGLFDAQYSIVRWVAEVFIPGVMYAMAGLAGAMYRLGRDAIDSFIRGLASKAGDLARTVTDLVTDFVTGPLEFALQFGSPSKVFMQYGEWSGEGYMIGLDRSLATADVAASFSPVVAAAGASSAGSSQPIQLVVDGRVLAETNARANRYAGGAYGR